MSLNIASINSGSNGNCYYIGNQCEAVLIDAGISCRDTENRMERLGLSMEQVRAIFISHEHTDHTRGLEVISRRYQLPVFISDDTHKYSRLALDESLVRSLKPYSTIQIGDLAVHAFPKLHDACEPCSFTVTGGGVTAGVLTDIGSVCDQVVHHFRQCHAAFLEANYDERMLEEGRYPLFLKRRIRGDHGHLSNRQALELFLEHKPPFMSHLLLSHLSHDNNSLQLVQDLFDKNSAGTVIDIASRYRESKVYTITGDGVFGQPLKPAERKSSPAQMSLF